MALDRTALYVPTPPEIMTVLGTKDKATVAWALQVTRPAVFELNQTSPAEIILQGNIVGARFETGLDSRIRTQRESIDRLLEHLKTHCPALLRAEVCPWMEAHKG